MTDETCGCGRCTRGSGTGPHHESYCDEYASEPGIKPPEWEDDTSYSYMTPRREQPVRVVSIELDGMQLVVHRLVQLPGWYCSLTDNGRSLARDRVLSEDDIDLEEAKLRGLQMGLALLDEHATRYGELAEKLRRT